MNYVLERVPPPRPGLPRPRFSLYLSSQLQYGVIVVYHRQCAILLGKTWLTGWRKEMLRQTQWFLNLCPSRGTSVHRGPAGETEDVPENWYGWLQQVRTGAQHATHSPACTNTKITQALAALPPVFSQTTSGLPWCPVSLGGDRRSPRPLIWSDVHARCHIQSQYTDKGTQITM